MILVKVLKCENNHVIGKLVFITNYINFITINSCASHGLEILVIMPFKILYTNYFFYILLMKNP